MRTEYRELSPEEQDYVLQIKQAGQKFYSLVDDAHTTEYQIAKEKIQEAVMWAVKGITG